MDEKAGAFNKNLKQAIWIPIKKQKLESPFAFGI